MTRFFTRLFGTRTSTPARPARRARVSLESLETRATPSGGLAAHDYHDYQVAEKRTILTLHDLPPGNYSASYSFGHGTGGKILAHSAGEPRPGFTLVN